MGRVRASLIAFAIAVTSGAAKAIEAVPMTAETLHIHLAADQKIEASTKKDWTAACEVLGKALLTDRGPWGFGVFKRHDCSAAKAVAGEWELLIKPDSTTIHFTLRYADLKKPIAKLSYVGGQYGVKLLSLPEFSALIAAALLDQMPMVMPVGQGHYDKASQSIVTKPATKMSQLPLPPKKIAIYSLNIEKKTGIFQPRVVATGLLVDPKKKAAKYKWKLNHALPEQANLWVQNLNGRSARKEQLAQAIADAAEDIVDGDGADKLGFGALGKVVLGSVAAGFIGVRYAHSFFKGAVIEDMSIFSLVTELRGPPLEGLRFYYDLWPTVVKRDATIGALSFGGQRAILGWSFGFNLPRFIDRIDIVPKIGRWSVKAEFAGAISDTEIGRATFDSGNALSLGLEIGIEKRLFRSTLARAWVSNDFGNFLSRKPATTVTDFRTGVDVLVVGPRLGAKFALSFLGFSFYEKVSMKNHAEVPADQLTTTSLNYKVGYLGGGLALSW